VSLAISLQNQLAHNPWPASAEKVIFLLDTTRRFERQLLENWIALHANQSIDHTIELLDLRDDRKALNVAALAEALNSTQTPRWHRSGYLGFEPKEAPAQDPDYATPSAAENAGPRVGWLTESRD
jgi:hypothetical protein